MKKFFALMLLVGALFVLCAPAFADGDSCPMCGEHAVYYNPQASRYECAWCYWKWSD